MTAANADLWGLFERTQELHQKFIQHPVIPLTYTCVSLRVQVPNHHIVSRKLTNLQNRVSNSWILWTLRVIHTSSCYSLNPKQ